MDIKPFSPKQKICLSWWADPAYRDYDALICDGSVRSGKTFAMALGFFFWGVAGFAGGTFALCGKTVNALRRNIITPLLPVLSSAGFSVHDAGTKGYLDVTALGSTARFYLFSGKDESSASLIQGMTLCGVFFDEVVLMPRSFVEQALARCSAPGAKFWFNCNPEHPSHWFYREWILKADKKHALHLSFTMDDNPALSPAVRERYERLYAGVFYDRFILGKWTVPEGLVYPMFDPARLVTSKLPSHCSRYVISCDYGTINPTSMGLWGERDGIWYRLREYYYAARRTGVSRTDEEHYKGLVALAGAYPIECVVIDPSAASFIACILSHGRFRVVRAVNSVLSGIRLVADALLQGRLRFSSECTDILREFTLYRWRTDAAGDLPEKEHDHAMDDMRYFVSTVLHGGIRTGFTAVNLGR